MYACMFLFVLWYNCQKLNEIILYPKRNVFNNEAVEYNFHLFITFLVITKKQKKKNAARKQGFCQNVTEHISTRNVIIY